MTRAEIDALRAELNHGLGSADYGYIRETIIYGKTIDDELSERGLTAVSDDSMTDTKRAELVKAWDEAKKAWDEADKARDEANKAGLEAYKARVEADKARVEAYKALREYDKA